jgi:SAM-dependent methyltransferase
VAAAAVVGEDDVRAVTAKSFPSTPYDELPYRSIPIEWTAPERLALASLLHGGPRQRLEGYRVLELGCADGTNLIPMAYYRRDAEFVGIDNAHSRIAIANEKRSSLGLTNVIFVATDLESASNTLSGQFDFIVGHGVFSWISQDARDALLALCAERLRPSGLLYLNYNTSPGWNVRGLIRAFLLSQTAKTAGLQARTERAREISATMAQELAGSEHPFSKLLGNEFRFVGENHLSHTAHEYLADHNDAYSRRAFLDLVAQYDLGYVADADFNYSSGRLPEALSSRLAALDIDTEAIDETADLFCYRQLHSPILTQREVDRRPPDTGELSRLVVASCLVERDTDGDEASLFEHPSGFEVRAQSGPIVAALRTLRPLWPRGLPVGNLFADVADVSDDLRLLHRSGLVDLRLMDPGELGPDPDRLHRLERFWGGYTTTPYHTTDISALVPTCAGLVASSRVDG